MNQKEIVERFCDSANWAYESWLLQRSLFDDNEAFSDRMQKHRPFFQRLNHVTLEYSLLQIAKLHDPALQKGSSNLTVTYLVEKCAWTDATRDKLQILASKLELFYQSIKPARMKVLAHSDLGANLAGNPIGAFPKDKDVSYFSDLKDFVSAASLEATGTMFVLCDLAIGDTEVFLNDLYKPVQQIVSLDFLQPTASGDWSLETFDKGKP